MSSIEESVEVEVPVRTAYNQWTQFEESPGLWRESRRCDRSPPPGRTGSPKWVAYSESSTPRSPSRSRMIGSPARALIGQKQAGVVTFHRLGDGRTRHGRGVLARPLGTPRWNLGVRLTPPRW